MELFSLLFDSNWREQADSRLQARYGQHHNSMAEQVMANRSEVAYLHGEVDRISRDLASSMLLNRALVEILLTGGVTSAKELREKLSAIVAAHEPETESGIPPTRFCENCGRPLGTPGQKCSFCSEPDLSLLEIKKKKKTSKKSSSKRKKTKKAKA